MKKLDIFPIVMVVGTILTLAIFLTHYSSELSFDSDAGEDFITLLPGIVVTIIGFLVVSQLGGVWGLPGLGATGLGLAYLAEQLYDLGYISTQMLTGLTIGEVQLMIIVISCLTGGIVTATSKKW